MEVSVMGSSQMNLGRSDMGGKEVGYCSFNKNLNSKSKLCVGQSIKLPEKSMNGFSLKASACTQSEPVISENGDAYRKSKPTDDVQLFVGLPLDAVSNTNAVNHPRAIAAGLKALKLLGVYGIELPVWWGVVEKETMGKYDWTGYLALAEMIQNLGLKLHVSLCSMHQRNQKFHSQNGFLALVNLTLVSSLRTNQDNTIKIVFRSLLLMFLCLTERLQFKYTKSSVTASRLNFPHSWIPQSRAFPLV
ncbi:hypothetical protein K7X08_008532 [Anisodus acutangulus]|uniref:Beta-amylase n=1 Tax=Anisodus acutangulus TaxID=402998 RepID=A0A9Q1RPF5_9SOLA|nr:hypothetical protein K7X08_008532 [Anisodus acutangulus]